MPSRQRTKHATSTKRTRSTKPKVNPSQEIDIIKNPEFLSEYGKLLELKYGNKKYVSFVTDVFKNINSTNLLPKYPLNTLEEIFEFENTVLNDLFQGYTREYTDISIGAETAQELQKIIAAQELGWLDKA